MLLLSKNTKAPAFVGVNEMGEEVRLSQFAGNRLALFFYPKDMTPGCTFEVQSLRDHYGELIAKGIEVLGVSADSVKRHCKFIEKEKLPYHLISDEDKIILKEYKVWGPKKFMGREYEGIHRTTYLIDEQGMIEHVIEKVKSKNHAQQILDLIEN